MRMWMLNPKILCRQHLLGEHGELHKFKPLFEKQQPIKGRVEPIVQIEPNAMKARHDLLAKELLLRGMNHLSPYDMPDLSYLPPEHKNAKVDKSISYLDLTNRCEKCKARASLLIQMGMV